MYRKVIISAPTRSEAQDISEKLIKEKLVAGCRITVGDSLYWWDGKVRDEEYYNISCYSTEVNVDEIIEIVEDIHSDDTPIVEVSEIDGNTDFLDWIEENVSERS